MRLSASLGHLPWGIVFGISHIHPSLKVFRHNQWSIEGTNTYCMQGNGLQVKNLPLIKMVQFYRALIYIWISLCLRALLHCHSEPSVKTRNEGIISCTKEEWKMNDQSFVMQRTPEIFTRLPRWSTLYSMHLQPEISGRSESNKMYEKLNIFK